MNKQITYKIRDNDGPRSITTNGKRLKFEGSTFVVEGGDPYPQHLPISCLIEYNEDQ